MTFDLAAIDGVILDMDGVIWRGAEILPSVPDLFDYLREQRIPYQMATNNSTRTAAEYVARLTSLGVVSTEADIVTSGFVTLEALKKEYPAGTPIYVIGADSLIALLRAGGFSIDPDQAQVIVVGLDVTLTYDKLRIAGRRLLAGAAFIGTNADRTLPTAEGVMPGAGSIIAALEMMTERKARLMGKPEPVMFQIGLQQLRTTPSRTLMIGDRLDTDIEGAQRAKLKTALVLTGVSTQADVDSGAIKPDAVYDSLADVLTAWRAARG